MSRRKLFDLLDNTTQKLPANQQFCVDVMSAIERKNVLEHQKGSQWYKPSSLHCLRRMYFTRIGADEDVSNTEYKSIGMADTGTRRHEAIQDVLLDMTRLGYDWEYVDVAEYVEMKQAQGKCKTLIVKERVGAETKLFDTALKISFRCDGIIKRISTNEYYLFEFKNVASFKFNSIEDEILEQHHNQVICYCTALDLDKAFVTYEDRNMCELKVPEIFIVTPEMKEELTNRLFDCEGYVERMIPAPKEESSHNCRWCPYRSACKKVGD